MAVTPINLVPACFECNHSKGAALVDTFHPYFDDIESEEWLQAVVVETKPCVILFEVTAPDSWSESFRTRVYNHFKVFGLGGFYSSQSARRLVGERHNFATLHKAGGPVLVAETLERERASWAKFSKNCWETAFYRAAAESFWFCDGGFAA